MAEHYSQLYREIRSIDPRDYQRIIRTYEEKELEIGRLDVLENFELTVSYVDALFETGAYRRYLLMVDPVVEACMRYDLRRAPGVDKDVFEHMLFRKAASQFRLQRYAECEHVVRELIKMRPAEGTYVRFLRTCLFRRQRGVLQFGRASFIFCILTTALLVTINLLVVRHFFSLHTRTLNYITGDLLLVGLLTLAGCYAFAFFRARREALQFQATRLNKKRP